MAATIKSTIGRTTGKITIAAIRTSVRKAVVATQLMIGTVAITVITTATAMSDKMIVRRHKAGTITTLQRLKPPSLAGMSGRKNAVKSRKTITLRMTANAVMKRGKRKFRTVATKKKTVATGRSRVPVVSKSNPKTINSGKSLASEAVKAATNGSITEAVADGRRSEHKLAVVVAIGKAAAAGLVGEVNFKFTDGIGAVAEMVALLARPIKIAVTID